MRSLTSPIASIACKWLAMAAIFSWLVGCQLANKTAKDPFLSREFSCGEPKPASAHAAAAAGQPAAYPQTPADPRAARRS